MSCGEEAEKIINGDRRAEYGPARESFQRVADFWNIALRDKLKDLCSITAEDVAMLMILFKCARELNRHKHDNLVDIVGYTLLLERLIEEETSSSKQKGSKHD